MSASSILDDDFVPSYTEESQFSKHWPYAVYANIMKFLPIEDVCRSRRVCTRFHQSNNWIGLWEDLIIRDFPRYALEWNGEGSKKAKEEEEEDKNDKSNHDVNSKKSKNKGNRSSSPAPKDSSSSSSKNFAVSSSLHELLNEAPFRARLLCDVGDIFFNDGRAAYGFVNLAHRFPALLSDIVNRSRHENDFDLKTPNTWRHSIAYELGQFKEPLFAGATFYPSSTSFASLASSSSFHSRLLKHISCCYVKASFLTHHKTKDKEVLQSIGKLGFNEKTYAYTAAGRHAASKKQIAIPNSTRKKHIPNHKQFLSSKSSTTPMMALADALYLLPIFYKGEAQKFSASQKTKELEKNLMKRDLHFYGRKQLFEAIFNPGYIRYEDDDTWLERPYEGVGYLPCFVCVVIFLLFSNPISGVFFGPAEESKAGDWFLQNWWFGGVYDVICYLLAPLIWTTAQSVPNHHAYLPSLHRLNISSSASSITSNITLNFPTSELIGPQLINSIDFTSVAENLQAQSDAVYNGFPLTMLFLKSHLFHAFMKAPANESASKLIDYLSSDHSITFSSHVDSVIRYSFVAAEVVYRYIQWIIVGIWRYLIVAPIGFILSWVLYPVKLGVVFLSDILEGFLKRDEVTENAFQHVYEEYLNYSQACANFPYTGSFFNVPVTILALLKSITYVRDLYTPTEVFNASSFPPITANDVYSNYLRVPPLHYSFYTANSSSTSVATFENIDKLLAQLDPIHSQENQILRDGDLPSFVTDWPLLFMNHSLIILVICILGVWLAEALMVYAKKHKLLYVRALEKSNSSNNYDADTSKEMSLVFYEDKLADPDFYVYTIERDSFWFVVFPFFAAQYCGIIFGYLVIPVLDWCKTTSPVLAFRHVSFSISGSEPDHLAQFISDPNISDARKDLFLSQRSILAHVFQDPMFQWQLVPYIVLFVGVVQIIAQMLAIVGVVGGVFDETKVAVKTTSNRNKNNKKNSISLQNSQRQLQEEAETDAFSTGFPFDVRMIAKKCNLTYDDQEKWSWGMEKGIPSLPNLICMAFLCSAKLFGNQNGKEFHHDVEARKKRLLFNRLTRVQEERANSTSRKSMKKMVRDRKKLLELSASSTPALSSASNSTNNKEDNSNKQQQKQENVKVSSDLETRNLKRYYQSLNIRRLWLFAMFLSHLFQFLSVLTFWLWPGISVYLVIFSPFTIHIIIKKFIIEEGFRDWLAENVLRHMLNPIFGSYQNLNNILD